MAEEQTPESSPAQVTQLLTAWSRGDRDALEELVPLVYSELHRLASRHMRREEVGHTLQSTALVNEAYLKMVNSSGSSHIAWRNRAHFFAVAAGIIRNLLIDHARAHRAEKRGGGVRSVTIDERVAAPERTDLNLHALDGALERLAALDAKQARIVELRFFGGLSLDETAEVMHISRSSVKRDWAMAKTWLYRELSK